MMGQAISDEVDLHNGEYNSRILKFELDKILILIIIIYYCTIGEHGCYSVGNFCLYHSLDLILSLSHVH